jgi:Mn-dependent DtxR family transcriptional regulator
MLGVQRSTVSSVTSILQKAGLIVQGRGTIRVTNREGLEATACECYRAICDSFNRLLPGALRCD